MTITTIHDVFAERSGGTQSSSLYALIDCSADTAIYDEIKKSFAHLRSETLYDGLPDDIQKSAPLLVAFTEKEEEWIKWLEAKSVGISFAAVLWSGLSLNALAKQLTHQLDQTLPDGQAVLFRFFDPRIIGALVPILDERQKSILFGSIHRWGWWNRCGVWESFAYPNANHSPEKEELSLTVEQVAKLSNANLPDEVKNRIEQYDSALLHGNTRCINYKKINSSIQSAKQKFKLISAEDIGLFCIFDFQFKPSWTEVSPFTEALQYAQTGNKSFTDIVEEIPDTRWRTFQEAHGDLVIEYDKDVEK